MAPTLTPVVTQFDPQAPSSSRPQREPKKKALLIGINGLSSPTIGYDVLRGSHRDVAEMKRLLIGGYGYPDEDIQVLVDDGIPGHVQPERQNIMMGIENLVNDTHKGDKLFFHYCGHTIQVPTRSNSEEDGLDECLVPLDGEEQMITDNELRARLVDTLPVGVSLVAVLDSCHSASLLDLEHSRCNRVFVPWQSKGKRQGDEIRNRMVRRLAIPTQSPSWATTSRTILQSARTSPTRIRSRRTSIDTVYTPATSPRKSPYSPLTPRRRAPWNSPVTQIDENPGEMGDSTEPRLSISRSRAVSRKSHIPPPLRSWETNKENRQLPMLATGGFSVPCTPNMNISPQSAMLNTPIWCESPDESFCQGWCRVAADDASSRVKSPTGELADVISLASCKDSELSWENASEGVSMTQALISVLNQEAHPPLRDLVTKISHVLHDWSLSRHTRAKVYNRYWKRYRASHASKSPGPGTLDTETFQHPQIASHKPLDMDRRWDL
ncbi:caspase domain-containing protein [Mycena alexandri]|uniref:Caspase domain-containing protein n=1 Tax=Mycena alexandri TaxID=1745969 RepID=A0AAD6SQX4_9AGAR|nr:caspase domain-containing protein [Mycena alexandri]